ncbi:MAG: HEPN domain-containing protein [Terriglobia bacterium]
MTVDSKVRAHLAKAKRKLGAAQLLLDHDSERGSVPFAYFAMFHAATAMGLAEGKTVPPCSGWLAAFEEALPKAGKIDPKYHADLLEAYRLRQVADYDVMTELPPGVAEATLRRATEFLAMAETFLEGVGRQD